MIILLKKSARQISISRSGVKQTTIISRKIYELPLEKRFIKITGMLEEEKNGTFQYKKETEKVGIILPTYNEKKNIALLIPVIEEIFEKYGINGYIFVVDDNSADGTSMLALDFAKHYHNIIVIQRPGKLGLGSAYRIGFKRAIALGMDLIFEMDADWSHRPSYIPKFLSCIKKYDADLVIGSRYCHKGSTKKWPASRKLISFGANLITSVALGVKQTKDTTSGFRAYRAGTLDKIDYSSLVTNGYAWQIETLYRASSKKQRIREIPIIFHEREVGKSKLGGDDIKEFLVFLIRAFLNRITFGVFHKSP